MSDLPTYTYVPDACEHLTTQPATMNLSTRSGNWEATVAVKICTDCGVALPGDDAILPEPSGLGILVELPFNQPDAEQP